MEICRWICRGTSSGCWTVPDLADAIIEGRQGEQLTEAEEAAEDAEAVEAADAE